MTNPLFSRAPFVALLALTVSACVAAPADSNDPEQAQQDDALSPKVSFKRLAFGSLSSGDQGPANNADIEEVQSWVLADGITVAHTQDLQGIKQAGKTPYIHFYIAAGLAKKAYTIDDCNVTSFDKSLCKWGGDYIAKHTAKVIAAHRAAAKKVQKIMGSSPVLVHVEPDWYQYTEPGSGEQKSVHPLSTAESGSILDKIVDTIHASCASCNVVLDVSPWASDLGAYFSHVKLSSVAYVGLVGKPFNATSGKIDNYTYKEISTITGKKIIVNTAHGAGGWPTSYDGTWDGKLDAMWSAGVAGVIQSNKDRSHYEGVIAGYKAAHGGGGGAPPPAAGSFSFSVASSINQWWIQVHVSAPGGAEVTSVWATVNGGSYPLKLQSWGDWAVSPTSAVPAGAHVVFTAHDSQGHTGTMKSQGWPAK